MPSHGVGLRQVVSELSACVAAGPAASQPHRPQQRCVRMAALLLMLLAVQLKRPHIQQVGV